MSTIDGASKTASQATGLTQPLPATGVPTVNYAIAMQQYQFQQSLVARQLLAQQQAAAHAVSIKAAAEQSAARAAEISILLNSEKSDVLKENAELGSKRKKSELKSRSPSPSSSESSKSRSASPIRYRSNRTEHDRYSRMDHRSYWSRRRPGYKYSRGYGELDHLRSTSSKKDTDHSHGRRYSYDRRNMNTSRSSKGSESRPRSLKYPRAESRSPRRPRIRSPSDHSAASGDRNGRIMLKSPNDRRSISSSPRKLMSRSLSPRDRSQSYISASFSMEDKRVRHHGSSNEETSAPDVGNGRQVKEGTPFREEFIKTNHSKPSSRSESTSIDHSIKKNQLEPIHKKVVTNKLGSANGQCSSSTTSDEESVHSAPQRSADSMDHQTRLLDSRFGVNEDLDNMHVGIELRKARGLKLHGSMVEERRNDQYHMKVDWCSSPEHTLSHSKSLKLNNTLEQKAQSKAVTHLEEKSHFSPDAKTENASMKVKMDYEKCSEDVITTKDARFEESHSYDKLATCYNLPEVSADGKLMLSKSPEEVDCVQEYDAQASLFPEIPTVYQYPQEKPRRRSRSRERRRKDRRRHKRRSREEFEDKENDVDASVDRRNEGRNKGKLRRHRKKHHHGRHLKDHKESKGKRKHQEMSSSSLEDSCSSFDNEYKKRHVYSSKKPARSKKRRHSPSSTSSR
ncbi:bcl-2-associated transcription factor 1-like protein [Cinnamomum micranthum f. kanehirae]|uniref:Bcl-2-associated transcription factor 1-like protein n=1 Tax=Cinnamomum micranthum f. kanehirae TaxID=337451 RepID=A0A443P7N5_9MAGN|nr:bcl-2-associated transcription factor 1-like protein [Cinnamomum micranthum f. kanehirae]